ncbi:hypothetical protein Bca4012_049663 [Brassica carinata]
MISTVTSPPLLTTHKVESSNSSFDYLNLVYVSTPPNIISHQSPITSWRRQDYPRLSPLAFSSPFSTDDVPTCKLVTSWEPHAAEKARRFVDITSRFLAEIINSDKMKVHEELHINTNQVTMLERRTPHHI